MLNLWWLLVLCATYLQQYCVGGTPPQPPPPPQVPCLFIFGDSLSDAGNNNKLRTDAKVNYLPYGIDFPGGPTGRFTNGLTSVDIITQLLGLKDLIPPFANTGASDILKGVNYASGSAGIRKETGTHLGEDISFGLQLQNHKSIVSKINKKLGNQAQQHLNKCLYYVNIGSNDYLNNYFLPEHYPTSKTYSPEQYAVALAKEYSTYLKDLHAVGARKFALIGLGLIGCVPHEVSIHRKNGSSLCVEHESKAAILFNDKLKAVVDRFNVELSAAKFILINTAVLSNYVEARPMTTPGIVDVVCCKVGSNGQCIPNKEACKNRNQYPFFDEFHPTEMANQATARHAYIAPVPAYAYPMDICQLVNARNMQEYSVVGKPQVPCVFIFGDSLSDSGNNNELYTDATANYFPYGIDFPAGPTGRFTNGRTSIDIITQLLGFDDFIPPFTNTSDSNILKGVNYASGAAGIRFETGTHLGEDIGLEFQLLYHKIIVFEIIMKLGSVDEAQQHLNKCLYYVNIGSNDYLNNYFLPEHYLSSQLYSPDQYAEALVQEYSTHLKDLYSVGARKFALIGLNLLGCTPHEIFIHGKNGSICVEEESKTGLLFNDKLKAVVDGFNEELSDAKFIFINSALISYNTRQLQDVICCKVGSNGQCIPKEEPCQNRNQYPFFDAFHPTEIANQVIAKSAYNSPIPAYAYPMDISHLVKL
ncbi:GDSL esterase/lipase, partial [Mucuna pruriens]